MNVQGTGRPAALATLGILDGPLIQALTLIDELIIPTIASTTINANAEDLLKFQQDMDFTGLAMWFTLPAFTSVQLPAGATLTVTLQSCADPLFGSGITNLDSLVINGSASGAPATTAWGYLPVTPGSLRYARLQLVTNGTAVPGNVVGTYAIAR